MSFISTTSLIDVSDSVLVVIDVQDAFLDKLALAKTTIHEAAATSAPPSDKETLVNRIVWLMELAQTLQVPMIVTAEDIDVLGSVAPALEDKLSSDTVVHNKMVFGMADNLSIMQALKATNRKTAILVGLETDVCIAHSALGLQQTGYRVAVVTDAVASPGIHHQYGLDRMYRAGIILTNVKGLYFEWVRTVAKDNQLKKDLVDRIGSPKGIIL